VIRIVYYILVIIDHIISMSFESAITIILTALAVMLAILAIGIAVLAIWGYAGFKDFVREAARSHVSEAMAIKMKEYPGGSEVLESMKQLKERADMLEGIQNQLVAQPPPKPVASASNSEVQVTPIDKYPGEEDQLDASDRGENIQQNDPSAPDAGSGDS
jgi:hypothetical protein